LEKWKSEKAKEWKSGPKIYPKKPRVEHPRKKRIGKEKGRFLVSEAPRGEL
jgi:hypothetical protein